MTDTRCGRWAAESGIHKWEHVLLTDSGWYGEYENGVQRIHENILCRFHDMLGKPAAEAKVLFIPTAANSDESRPAAGKCFAELLSAGISPNNIRVYDVDCSLSEDEAMVFDVIYFTGGDTGYLLRRLRDTGFDNVVKKMVYVNKVYVGVSAGSLIAAPNIGEPYNAETAGLCLINAYLSFHNPKGAPPRTDMPLPHIPLSGGQALAVSWKGYEMVE
ncbi:MAG: Type 1 glutamine amidotransferase-like domain-containing protein [Defluviitaleaceae bacterium]|nr:Type 1 glutamine amidotransferase-like domain-containing protein [Defluviitaleaceae bacterium]